MIDKLKTPEATFAEIKAVDDLESAVHSAVTIVENCCTRSKISCILGMYPSNTPAGFIDHSATREYNKGRIPRLSYAACDAKARSN